MFIRSRVWQKAIISFHAENGWENIIILNYPCVDIKFKLKGYGWKPSAEITELTILYEGRYDCFYRERGAMDWISFATVISERASAIEARVYKDCFAFLGLVQNKTYEIKIVASDAEKFINWGGVLEGISSGSRFCFDLQMRADRPLSISANEKIAIEDFGYSGKQLIDFARFEGISIKEEFIPNKIYLVEVSDLLNIQDYLKARGLTIGISRYESMIITEIALMTDLIVEVGIAADTTSIMEDVSLGIV